ncbi:hypothetical protein SVIOM74S_05764 [Streptomyces violarus]
MNEHLPVFGPFEVQGGVDELEPAVAVVRVAFALTRTQLLTALAMSFAGLGADRTPESLTDDEVRREVEGQLAAEAIIELDHLMEANERTVFPPEQQRAMDLLGVAVDRAFAATPPLPVQEPRRGEGTVTLQTVDRGEVTVPEPKCGEPRMYRRHLRNGEAPCDACRAANAAADRRYRLTGSQKAAA